jgi:integrase
MPYKMKSGKWRAEKMFDGRRRTSTFLTKAEAKKWEAEQTPEPPESKPIHTALSLASQYLDHCKNTMQPRTYAEKKDHFKVLFRHARPDADYLDITPKQVFDALSSRARVSGTAANRCRKDLLAWSAWVDKVHGLETKAFRQGRWPEDEKPRYVPSEADFWSAYNQAEPEDKTLLLAYLHTAARRGELFRLLWSDVDLDAGTIRLSTRKRQGGGVEYDTIPMTARLTAALREHRRTALRGLHVFTTRRGRTYTSRQVWLEGLCARAGVKPFTIHAIRHLSASMLGRSGVPLATVQAILRHKSAMTTARYLHDLGIMQNALEQAFQGELHAQLHAPKIVNLK